MELTYLGQAGFLIEDNERRYLIDPYLSNYVVTGGIGDPEYFSRVFKKEMGISPSEFRAQ